MRLHARVGDECRSDGPTAVYHRGAAERAFAFLFVLSFAFDFKGTEGGTASQFLMAGANALFFIAIVSLARFTFPRRGMTAASPWMWFIFLCAGSLGAILARVPFGHFVRVIYPFVLFAEGSYVGWWVGRTVAGRLFMIGSMEITALASLVFTVVWGFHFSGDTLQGIRYQILSPALPFLLAATFFDVFFGKRHRLRGLLVLAVITVIVGLSVTRGMVAVVAALFAVAFCLWGLDVLSGRAHVPRPIGVGAFTAAWGIALAAIIGVAMVPELAGRWVQRVAGSAHNVTLLTRAAAVVGQWHQLGGGSASWAVGRGFGHSYSYAQIFYPLIYPHMSSTVFTSPMWYGAEFMWIAPVFDGGLIGGVPAVLVLLWGAWIAIRRLRDLFRASAWRLMEARPEWIAGLALLAFLVDGFTSNPFNKRLSALLLGLCLGILARKSILRSGLEVAARLTAPRP